MAEETVGVLRDSSYRACNGLRTHADPPLLRFSNRPTAGRAPVAYEEKVKCRYRETASSRAKLQSSGSSIVPSVSPLPHRETEW